MWACEIISSSKFYIKTVTLLAGFHGENLFIKIGSISKLGLGGGCIECHFGVVVVVFGSRLEGRGFEPG